MNQFNWSEPELLAYDEEIKRIRDNIAAMDYQYDKGKAEGKAERDIEIALNLLRQNLSLDVISSATGLSHNELTELKAKL